MHMSPNLEKDCLVGLPAEVCLLKPVGLQVCAIWRDPECQGPSGAEVRQVQGCVLRELHGLPGSSQCHTELGWDTHSRQIFASQTSGETSLSQGVGC